MAFPTTGILDSFGGTLGSWTIPAYPGNSSLQIIGGQLAGASSAFSDGCWNTSFNADQEAYITVATYETRAIDLYLRITSPGVAGVDMYDLAIGTDGVWQWYRIVNSSGSAITGTTTQVPANGSSIGAEVLGTGATVTLNAYYKTSGGSWSNILASSDSNAARLVTGGQIGVQTYHTVQRLDDFGGGSVVSGIEKLGSGVIGP